jgi:hypothetical protein
MRSLAALHDLRTQQCLDRAPLAQSLDAEPQATEIVARSFGIVVLFSKMAGATRVLVPLGWSH